MIRPQKNPFLSLKYKNFRYYWIGFLISRIGSEMQNVAVAWHLYSLTHSPLSLGIIGLVRFLPIVLFSPFAGMIADIHDRKKIMMLTDAGAGFFAAILAIRTVFFHVTPLEVYVLVGLAMVCSAFNNPARNSMIPSLVPRENLMNAYSLQTILWQSSTLTGPALAGFIIAYFGVGTTYLLNAISFVAIIIAALVMRLQPIPQDLKPRVSFKSFVEGLAFIKSNPLIYSTMLLDFFATFFSTGTVLLPIFAKDILKVGPQGLGFLYAAPSFGALICGIFVASFHEIKHQGKILLVSVIIYGFATFFFGISKIFYLSLFFLSIAGAADIVSSIIRNTIRQLSTPDTIRGRMTSINTIFVAGGPQLGEVEAGALANVIGAEASTLIGGACTVIFVLLVTVFVPKLKKFEGHEVHKG